MNKLTETLRRMSLEKLTANDVREMIINQVVFYEQDESDNGEGVCDGLLQTYRNLCSYDEDGEEVEVVTVDYSEAEKLMLKFYTKGGESSFKGFSNEGWMWPETFTYNNDRSFPKEIAKAVGYALGCLDGARSKAMAEYFAA